MNHLLVGCGVPFAAAVVVYVCRRFRASMGLLVATPVLMFLCATWAVVPDLPRIVGWDSMDARMASANNPWIDVFFWHYTINQHESYSPWFNVGFVFMLACLFFAAWRELRLAEGKK